MRLTRVFGEKAPLYNNQAWGGSKEFFIFYVGPADGGTQRCYIEKRDFNGNIVKSFSNLDLPNVISFPRRIIIKNNFVYLSGGSSWNQRNNDENLTHVRTINAQNGNLTIDVDNDGNVYTGGDRTGNLTTRKYDTNGTLLWSRDHGANVRAIAVDNDGNVYTGGVRTSNLTTRKYDTNGTLLWSRNHGALVRAIAVDNDGNVYTGGDRTSNLTTRKYDTNGTLLWSRDDGANVSTDVPGGIALDTFNNLYTVSGNSVRKRDTNGTLLWTINQDRPVRTVAVKDRDGVYIGTRWLALGDRNQSGIIAKYDFNGNLIYQDIFLLNPPTPPDFSPTYPSEVKDIGIS